MSNSNPMSEVSMGVGENNSWMRFVLFDRRYAECIKYDFQMHELFLYNMGNKGKGRQRLSEEVCCDLAMSRFNL